MKCDDAVERVAVELGLEQAHLGFARVNPKLTIQVAPATRRAGVVLVAGGIADGIEEQAVTAGERGRVLQHLRKLNDGLSSFRLVAMDGRKDAHTNRVIAAVGSKKEIPREL